MFRRICYTSMQNTQLIRRCISLHKSPVSIDTECLSLVKHCSTSIWDPPYINQKPDIPEYDELNITIRGYDFATVESFQKYAHNLTESLGLEIEAYPVPARPTRVHTYKPNSTKVLHGYDIAIYERTLQIESLPSTTAPFLLNALQSNLPEGVEFTLTEPDEDEDEFRYVPDVVLQELQDQLGELDEIREARKKK